jgi:hypothetical protein
VNEDSYGGETDNDEHEREGIQVEHQQQTRDTDQPGGREREAENGCYGQENYGDDQKCSFWLRC